MDKEQIQRELRNGVSIAEVCSKHQVSLLALFNELKTEQEQLTKETELYTMLSHTALINKALTKMIIEQNKLSK